MNQLRYTMTEPDPQERSAFLWYMLSSRAAARYEAASRLARLDNMIHELRQATAPGEELDLPWSLRSEMKSANRWWETVR